MFEVTRYEAERRLVGTLAVAGGLSAFAGLFLAIGPGIVEDVDLASFVESYPEALQTAFGLEGMGTFAGLLATELYQFGWVILLGLYYAYLGGGTVAGDIESDRLDLLLATPVSRANVLVEKFLALVPSMVLVNVVVGSVVYAGGILVGERLSLLDVAMVHLLSMPYLLTTAAIGLLFSVVFSRGSRAQRGAAATVFGLFMLESFLAGTDYGAVGALSPTRYYDPTEILVESSYAFLDALLLCEAAVLLVVVSVLWFQRRDV